MTSSAPQSAPQLPSPSPFTRARHPHPWLLAAGVTQLVLTHVAGLGYALLGIGVGTCSGTDGSGACGQVLDRYDLAGWALALNVVVGVLVVVLTRSPRPLVVRRVLAAAVVVSLVLGVVAGTALWSAAVSPLS
jgi:hypothetical protein